MDCPLVSVIIPIYNRENLIKETLESALSQTFKDFEVIALDDGSTDKTAEIVRQIAKADKRIIYFYQENKGIAASRNNSIKLSKGKYIAFLDSDDIWLPEKLEKQIPIFDDNPGTGLIFSNVLYFSDGRASHPLYKNKPPTGKIFRNLLMHSFICTSSVVIRREVFSGLDEWCDENLGMSVDLDILLRILYKWDARYVDGIFVKYRIHNESYTSKRRENIPKEKEYLLNKLLRIYPGLNTDFKSEVAYMKARIQYDYALLDWERGCPGIARKRIYPYLNVNKKLWVPYLFSYFPYSYYKRLLSLNQNNIDECVPR